MDLVYIVILNYNNWVDTIACISSLKQLTHPNYKIILVDNKSTDDSVLRIEHFLSHQNSYKNCEYPEGLPLSAAGSKREFSCQIVTNGWELNSFDRFEDLFFIKSDHNDGYASGNNVGMKFGLADQNCKYLWILNNDTVVDQKALSSLIYDFESRRTRGEKIGLLGSKLIFYYTPMIVQCVAGHYRRFFGFPQQIGLGKSTAEELIVDEDRMDYVSGAAVLTSRDFIDEVGYMSEDFFLYFEELDWAFNAKQHHYLLGYCKDSLVYHKDGASTKEDSKSMLSSPFSDYHFTRSKIIFSKHFFKNRMFFIYMSFLIVIANRLRRKQLVNIRSIISAIFTHNE